MKPKCGSKEILEGRKNQCWHFVLRRQKSKNNFVFDSHLLNVFRSFEPHGLLIRKNLPEPDVEFVITYFPFTTVGVIGFVLHVPAVMSMLVSIVNAGSFVDHETTALSPTN